MCGYTGTQSKTKGPELLSSVRAERDSEEQPISLPICPHFTDEETEMQGELVSQS